MTALACSIVSFWLGVAFATKVKAFFSGLFTQAKADAVAEEAKVVADVKAKV